MRRLSSYLTRSAVNSPYHRGSADELKRTNSDEVTEGNTSKTSADTAGKLVDILDVEDEVEIQNSPYGAVVASVFGEDEDVEDHDPELDLALESSFADNLTSPATNMVDRTPSKVHELRDPSASAEANGVPAPDQPQENVAPSPAPTPPSRPKPKYTKEEKQRRFLKELFRITSRHIKEGPVDDDDSIVSSAVGSVSSLPPPTVLDRFLNWFSCAASFQSGAIMDSESPCPCNKEHNKAVSSHEEVVVTNVAAVSRHPKDDDSLDQALAGLPPQTPRTFNDTDESETVTLPIASPITVQEEASVTAEIIDGDDGSGAVSVRYSVRHVASIPGTTNL
jgi:hypothetical protein